MPDKKHGQGFEKSVERWLKKKYEEFVIVQKRPDKIVIGVNEDSHGMWSLLG